MSSDLNNFQLRPLQAIADHGVEEDQELAHGGDDDDLGGFAGGLEPFGEALNDGVGVDGGEGVTLIQDTFIQLTNDNTSATKVQMYFVNSDPPISAP